MTTQSDILRFRATLEEDITGGLENLRKKMRDFKAEAGGATPGERANTNIRKFIGEVNVLRESFSGPQGATAAMTKFAGATGVAVFAVGSAVYAFSKASRELGDFSKRIADMQYQSQGLGLTINQFRSLQRAASDVRIDPKQFIGNLEGFSRRVLELRYNIGGIRGDLQSKYNIGPWINQILAAPNAMEQVRAAIGAIEDVRRRKGPEEAKLLAEQWGLGPDAWKLTMKALEDAERTTLNWTKEQTDAAEAYRQKWEAIERKVNDIKTLSAFPFFSGMEKTLGTVNETLGWIVEKLEKLNKWWFGGEQMKALESGSLSPSTYEQWFNEQRDQNQTGGGNDFGGTGGFGRSFRKYLNDKLFGGGSYHNTGFGGFGETTNNPEDVIKDSVKRGVVEGLQEFASLNADRNGGGFQNASLGNVGASVGGGRGWGSAEFPNRGSGAGVGGGGGGRSGGRSGSGGGGGGGDDAPSIVDPNRQGNVGAAGGGIDRSKWYAQLEADPAMKERLFRHSLGENTDPRANQAIMESAANRADIRGVDRFDQKGNLSYFQGYYRGHITAKMRRMLEDNYRKVFVEGSDISKGAVDNSSQGLAYTNEHGGVSGRYGYPGKRPGKFITTENFGGDRITGHPGVESFERPGWGESSRGEREKWPLLRQRQLEQMMLASRSSGGASAAIDRSMIDASLVATNVNAQGTVNVNVAAPKGTRVSASSEGLFQSTKITRQPQMAIPDGTY